MSDTISKEVTDYIENLNQQLDLEKSRRMTMESQINNSSLLSSGGKDQNVIELQLDVEKILDKIYHLLSGHEVRYNEETRTEYWGDPEDDRLITFSSYGVKQVMNLLSMYLNINKLMSFYELEVIRWKVLEFGIELSDLFENRYEALLYYPSPEELYEKYKPLINSGNLQITDQELYTKCIQWSEEELAAKENLLPIICKAIIDMVHDAYLRALKGKERQSLGERGINISQSNNPQEQILSSVQKKKGGFLGMFKG